MSRLSLTRSLLALAVLLLAFRASAAPPSTTATQSPSGPSSRPINREAASLIARAESAVLLGEYATAIDFYRRALIVYENAADPLSYAVTLGSIANCEMKSGRLDQAYANLEERRRRILAISPAASPVAAKCVSDLAMVLALQGRPSDAVPRYEEALAIYRRSPWQDDPLLVEISRGLGRCLRKLNRQSEALSHFREALAGSERAHRDQAPLVELALDDLATCLMDLNQQQEAIPLLERIVAGQRNRGDELALVTKLITLAGCYEEVGQPVQSISRYESALALLRRSDPKRTMVTALALSGLARCLDDAGRPKDALGRFEQAQEIFARQPAADSEYALSNLTSLGYCHEKLGQLEQALKTHEAAQAMSQRLIPRDKAELAGRLANVGRALFGLGQFGDALQKYDEAFVTYRAAPDADPREVVFALANSARCLRFLHRLDDALARQRQAVELAGERAADDCVLPVFAAADLAHILVDLGRASEGLSELEAAEAQCPDAIWSDETARRNLFESYGRSLACLGMYDQALGCLLLERAALDAIPTTSSIRSAENYFNQTRCYLALGDIQAARYPLIAGLKIAGSAFDGSSPGQLVAVMQSVADRLIDAGESATAREVIECAFRVADRRSISREGEPYAQLRAVDERICPD